MKVNENGDFELATFTVNDFNFVSILIIKRGLGKDKCIIKFILSRFGVLEVGIHLLPCKFGYFYVHKCEMLRYFLFSLGFYIFLDKLYVPTFRKWFFLFLEIVVDGYDCGFWSRKEVEKGKDDDHLEMEKHEYYCRMAKRRHAIIYLK